MPRVYKKNYLTQHRNGWRFVRAVPSELQGIEGTKQWSKYLGVIAYTLAEVQARKLAAHYDARIAKLARLSKADRDTVAREGSLADYARETEALEVQHAFQSAAVELMPITANVEYPGGAPQYLQDVAEWTDAANATKAKLKPRKRILGKTQEAKGPVWKLTALVDLWSRIKKPRNPKTIQKAHLYVARFIQVCGDREPREVTRADAVSFRDALDANPKLALKVADLHLEKMRTMFNVAIAEHALGVTANPFSLVKSRKVASDDRKLPFSLAQVATMLDTAPTQGHEFALITRLLAYHGARSGEFVQLTCGDVVEVYGVPAFEVHGRNGSIKNTPRQVPIHPVCLAAVQAQVEMAKKISKLAPDGSPWIFPQTVGAKATERGGPYQRAAGKFIRDVAKIADKRLTIHCLRHTFRDLCREAEMPEHISAAIMGHALGKGHHGATYGTGVSIKARAEWLGKIDPLKP